jgi:histidine ammonia-lyase
VKQKKIILNGENLSIDLLTQLIKDKKQLSLASSTIATAKHAHSFLNKAIEQNNQIIYGINTGFGPMANYILGHSQILELQKNLIYSHAVGLGESIKDDFVLSAMAIRLNTLAKGYSGTSSELLERLVQFINLRIIPVVPEHGAVGTSGDLVQLAHIALVLLGKGKVKYKNKIHKTSSVLKKLGLKNTYLLKPKEGLSLINGTSMMTGISAIVCEDSRNLLSLAVRNSALALELVRAYDDSYCEKLHKLRPHLGQNQIAKTLRGILKSSKLIRSRKSLHKNTNQGKDVNKINESVQEVYSMRCAAQILGPIYEAFKNSWETTEIEMNSVTDNPVIDIENNLFLHGGNFHGDYIAVCMDQLKASMVKLTILSERRLNFFLNHKINQTFPPFLNLKTPGLTLGLQGLQFVATSTTAHNQTLAYPMSAHSIPTNGDNQDVVSMGTDAALLASRVSDNATIVLTIESIALCQAVDYLKISEKLSIESKKLYGFVRENFEKITDDRHIQPELQALVSKIKTWRELNLFEKF